MIVHKYSGFPWFGYIIFVSSISVGCELISEYGR